MAWLFLTMTLLLLVIPIESGRMQYYILPLALLVQVERLAKV